MIQCNVLLLCVKATHSIHSFQLDAQLELFWLSDKCLVCRRIEFVSQLHTHPVLLAVRVQAVVHGFNKVSSVDGEHRQT